MHGNKSEQPNLLTNAVTYSHRKIKTNSQFTKTNKIRKALSNYLVFFCANTRATNNLIDRVTEQRLEGSLKTAKIRNDLTG